MDVDWSEIAAAMQRHDFLCRHVPSCPKCSETLQIQLLHSGSPPAWRCRYCKHHWTYEPVANVSKDGQSARDE